MCSHAVCDSSIRLQSPCLAHNVAHLWQKVFFLRRREGHRRVERSDADDRAVEIVESFFVDDGRDFSGQTPGTRMLVKDDYFVRLLDRFDYGGAIERRYRAQVDDLGVDAVAG